MWCCAMQKNMVINFVPLLANVNVYFLLLAKSQNCAVEDGLRRTGPLSLYA